MKLLLVFLGAGAGGALRFVLGGWVQRAWDAKARTRGAGQWHDGFAAFPIGTMAVNITGCLAIGVLAVLLSGEAAARENARVLLLAGVLGGFTTFSAFGRDTVDLLARGSWTAAMMNVLLSNALGIGAAWVGAVIARGAMGGVGRG